VSQVCDFVRRHGWILLASISLGCSSKQYFPAPSSLNASNDIFVKRGELTFWQTEALGEGNKTCASCHEKHVPFEAYRLARNYYELDGHIGECLTKRVGQVVGDSSIEIRALREYLLFHYVLGGVIHDESPEGIRRLGEGMAIFLDGRYEKALTEIYRARSLVKAQANMVQTYALEACIHLFMMNEEAADRAFAEALRLEPGIRVDNYVFSPKIIQALEATRARLIQAAVLHP
jgi:hypothetical protein